MTVHRLPPFFQRFSHVLSVGNMGKVQLGYLSLMHDRDIWSWKISSASVPSLTQKVLEEQAVEPGHAGPQPHPGAGNWSAYPSIASALGGASQATEAGFAEGQPRTRGPRAQAEAARLLSTQPQKSQNIISTPFCLPGGSSRSVWSHGEGIGLHLWMGRAAENAWLSLIYLLPAAQMHGPGLPEQEGTLEI